MCWADSEKCHLGHCSRNSTTLMASTLGSQNALNWPNIAQGIFLKCIPLGRRCSGDFFKIYSYQTKPKCPLPKWGWCCSSTQNTALLECDCFTLTHLLARAVCTWRTRTWESDVSLGYVSCDKSNLTGGQIDQSHGRSLLMPFSN